jgi:hypothetical protein
MEAVFQSLGFFASELGLITAAALAALVVILWDWRAALAALLVAQIAVASVSVLVYGMPAQWGLVQIVVMLLACLILGLSAVRMRRSPSQFEAGTWTLRSLMLALLGVCWWSLDLTPKLPVVGVEVTELFVWLALCALLMLGLGDNPLFTATGLLLWCVPAQALISIALAIPALVAVIGIIELLVALACSYLILVELLPVATTKPVLTDIFFPEQDPVLLMGDEPPGAAGTRPVQPARTAKWMRRRSSAHAPQGTQPSSPVQSMPRPTSSTRPLLARRRQ